MPRWPAMLVQTMLVTVGDELRLCRVTCGKALPFRRRPLLSNRPRAGWKAEPSSLRGGGPNGAGLGGKPEAFRKSGQRSRAERRPELATWAAPGADRRRSRGRHCAGRFPVNLSSDSRILRRCSASSACRRWTPRTTSRGARAANSRFSSCAFT